MVYISLKEGSTFTSKMMEYGPLPDIVSVGILDDGHMNLSQRMAPLHLLANIATASCTMRQEVVRDGAGELLVSIGEGFLAMGAFSPFLCGEYIASCNFITHYA